MADLSQPAPEAVYTQGGILTSSVGHSDHGSERGAAQGGRYPRLATQDEHLSYEERGGRTDPFNPNDRVGIITPPRIGPSVDGHLQTNPYGVEGPRRRASKMDYVAPIETKNPVSTICMVIF